MIELRTTSDEERAAMRKLARRMNAYLEVSDEDPDSTWYTLTEYAESDEDAAAQVKEIVGGRYEIV